MKNGKFEVGDLVERINTKNLNLEIGHRGIVTSFDDDGWPVLDNDASGVGAHCPANLKLISPKFNLKTQPWFINTETLEQRIAAIKWLFENGISFNAEGRAVESFAEVFDRLTNIVFDEVNEGSFYRVVGPFIHPSAQEIKLTYKTAVTDVVYPTVESERDKEIRSIREQQEALAARLKKLEVQS